MPNRYYTRRFLNKRGHHSGGYILAFVEDTSKRKQETDWTDTEFTVADCGRQISLTFEVSPEEFANSLHKVDVLIESSPGSARLWSRKGASRPSANAGQRRKRSAKSVAGYPS